MSSTTSGRRRKRATRHDSANPLGLVTWRPILQFYLHLDRTAQTRLRSSEGLPLRDAGPVGRAFLEAPPRQPHPRVQELLQQHGNTATVSLRMEAQRRGTEEIRQIVWEMRAPGTDGYRAVFAQKPRHPPEEAQTTRE